MGVFLQDWIAQFVGQKPAMLWLFAFLRWGLILATLLLGFSLIYIEHFANYEATYGAIGAVIVLTAPTRSQSKNRGTTGVVA